MDFFTIEDLDIEVFTRESGLLIIRNIYNKLNNIKIFIQEFQDMGYNNISYYFPPITSTPSQSSGTSYSINGAYYSRYIDKAQWWLWSAAE